MITSVYIHIPFCNHICTYCDFPKQFYNKKDIGLYLKSLKDEIVEKYQNELIKTIYIGGGTPSCLNNSELEELINITKIFKLDNDYEFTIEVNPESIDKEKLELLKKSGVNRISIGIESTNNLFLKYLGRDYTFRLVKEKINLIKKVGFNNINVDLIYAIPNESLHDLKKDLDNIISLNINHISTYSLEIHNNTILGIRKEKNIDDELDSDMYSFICNYLQEHGFTHYEISNFCRNESYSRHNLVYWNNNEYYGFGLGASGYLKNIRYTNTRSMCNYIGKKRIIYEEVVSKKKQISYALILGFRLIKGINKKEFKDKYHVNLIEQFNIPELIEKGFLIDDGLNIKISYDKIYVENQILENFL